MFTEQGGPRSLRHERGGGVETRVHRQGGSGHHTGRWHREDTHGSHVQLCEYNALFSSEEVISMLIGNRSQFPYQILCA